MASFDVSVETQDRGTCGFLAAHLIRESRTSAGAHIVKMRAFDRARSRATDEVAPMEYRAPPRAMQFLIR